MTVHGPRGGISNQLPGGASCGLSLALLQKSGSQAFWFQDPFNHLRILEDPEGLLFKRVIAIDIDCFGN